MVLRATRQYAEILASGDGKLRVTRQYVEILSPAFEFRFEHSLGLTQEVTTPIKNASVQQSLGLSQRTNTYFFVSLDHDLGLSDSVSKAVPAEASNILDLVGDATEMVHFNSFWPTQHSLNLQQTVAIGGHEFVESTLALTQIAAGHGPYYRNIWHFITFTDSVRSRNFYISIEDVLGLTDIAPMSFEAEASNTLTFTDEAWRRIFAENSLGLNQSMIWGKAKGVPIQELNLVSEVDFHGDWVRSVTHSLGIGHSLTYYYDTACVDRNYTPFIGESTVNSIEPPEAKLPFVQDSTKQFRLEYPALGAVDDFISIRAPELDNTDQSVMNRISRETRGGHLTVFADPKWPKVNTIRVTFIGLLKTEAVALQQFISAHIGEDILLTDWEGREWIGIITSPDEIISCDGEEKWTAAFTFDGVIIDYCTPDSGLHLTDEMTFNCDRSRILLHDLDLIQAATYILN